MHKGGPPDELDRLLRHFVHVRLGLDLSRGGTAQALRRYAELHARDAATVLTAGSELEDGFQRLVDAVTVQHSWLFRDFQQLEAAWSTFLGVTGRSAQVWVPACATGEDVYTMVALSAATHAVAEVLGTDINARAVQAARDAYYGEWSTRAVPDTHSEMLESGRHPKRIIAALRHRARFEVHNLLQPAPPARSQGGKWDLIVCRNVLIYLSHEHAALVLGQLRDALAVGGTLVLGASDILSELPRGLMAEQVDGRLVFRRQAPGPDETRTAPKLPLTIAAPARPPAPAIPHAGRQRAGAVRARQSASSGSAERPDVELSPDAQAAISHLDRGIEAHLAGDLKQSVKQLRAALYLLPNLWPASYYLALTYDALGRFSEARREYAHVSQCIEAGDSLPPLAGHDFSFLAQDITRLARRRSR